MHGSIGALVVLLLGCGFCGMSHGQQNSGKVLKFLSQLQRGPSANQVAPYGSCTFTAPFQCADNGCTVHGGQCYYLSPGGCNCWNFRHQGNAAVGGFEGAPNEGACITMISPSGGWFCKDTGCSKSGGNCVDTGNNCECKTSKAGEVKQVVAEEKLVPKASIRNPFNRIPDGACITVISSSGGWSCVDKGCSANGGRCNGKGSKCFCDQTPDEPSLIASGDQTIIIPVHPIQQPKETGETGFADDACITVISSSGGWFCQDRSCSANGGKCVDEGHKCVCK